MPTEDTKLLDDIPSSIQSYTGFEGDEEIDPLSESNSNAIPRPDLNIKRSKTLAMPPLTRKLTRNSFSVNNPQRLERKLSVYVENIDELYKRVDSLSLMRPFKLIGNAKRLINWDKYKTTEAKMNRYKNKGIRKYYEEQNELIGRYEDVDMLLDTGIHIEMIQNYEDNTSTDSSTSDEDEHLGICEGNHVDSSTNTSSKSKLTRQVKHKRRKHIHNLRQTPGDIVHEGAKFLGSAQKLENSTILYAIYFNFAINVVLLLGKIFVVYISSSMSIIASLVDSVLDFLSTLIIFVANKYASKKSSRFPIGRKQLEPIGVLVFSIVIIVSFLQVFIGSVQTLMGDNHTVISLAKSAILIMASTILIKIVAYVVCKNIDNSSVQALVEDAKTDIIFNTFSLIFPLFGWLFKLWWLDALGAACLCLYVISQWCYITWEHIDHLSGSKACKEDYQQVLYMVVRFTEKISKIKNYRIYHMGDLVNVEVDIVLKDRSLSLKDCHDLGESLQYAIETLPFVNRCFVHLDYKVKNYIGHIDG